MNNKLEAVVTDLDGSLISEQQQIGDQDLATIKKLKSLGIPVFIATGRSHSICRRFAMEIGEDLPVITTNGGCIFDFSTNKPTHFRVIEPHCVKEVYQFMTTIENFRFFGTADHDYFSERDFDLEILKHELDTYAFPYGGVSVVDNDFNPCDLPLTKMLIPNCTPDIFKNFLKLDCIKNKEVEYTYSGKMFMDITAKNAHKGDGVQILSKKYGFSLENTLAMGDNDNDNQMLNIVGYPVVPSSSKPEMQIDNRFVSKPNGQNPLTHSIQSLFPDLL